MPTSTLHVLVSFSLSYSNSSTFYTNVLEHLLHRSRVTRNIAKTKNPIQKFLFLLKKGRKFNCLKNFFIFYFKQGTTCAFTESILRSFGLKTGFFSSPHLVCVTERIRINGKPISKIKFNEYFWNVYTSMQRNSVGIYLKRIILSCF